MKQGRFVGRQIDFKSNEMKINAHIVDKGGTRRVDGRKNNKDYTIIMPFNVKEALLNIYNIEKIRMALMMINMCLVTISHGLIIK